MSIWEVSAEFIIAASFQTSVRTAKHIFASLLLIVSLLSVLASNAFMMQKAFADGLTQENLPPASIGNRAASLFVKVNPTILTTATRQDAYMQFRLFDANTNNTIQHTSYLITVTKGIAGTGPNEKPLMRDLFHSHTGLLTLKIIPQSGPLTILASQDPFQNAWVADPGGNIDIKGPIFLDGGLYHFHVEIFGIDNDKNIFIPSDAPKFDSWLSVGDVTDENVPFDGHNYNTTLVSYYDKVQDFKFDPAKKMFTWAMPFSWNVSRIKANNIFVHEEIRIPKTFPGLGNAAFYNATANGDVLTGRKLALDPYSYPDKMTLHYLLNKDDILQLANKVSSSQSNNNSSKDMTFSLAPASAVPVETTGDTVTDTGGIGVAIQWLPSQLNAGKESTLNLRFFDAFSGSPLKSDVLYNLNILNGNGSSAKPVYTKDNLTAKAATDTQTINFPANQQYNIQITVNGLKNPGQQVLDKTRTGVARGIVVVPEFPTTTTTTTAAAIATTTNTTSIGASSPTSVVFGLAASMMIISTVLIKQQKKNNRKEYNNKE